MGKLVKKNYKISELGIDYVTLLRDRKEIEMTVGLLTATVWIENPNNYSEVFWKDGNKANNHVDNLEWCE